MTVPTPSTACPRCSGQMEFGILVDNTHSHGTELVARGRERVLEWLRGWPKKSWFDLSFRAEGADRMRVATLRCTRYGYLDLDAVPKQYSEQPIIRVGSARRRYNAIVAATPAALGASP